MSIVNYATGVNEGGQHPSIFKDDGYKSMFMQIIYQNGLRAILLFNKLEYLVKSGFEFWYNQRESQK